MNEVVSISLERYDRLKALVEEYKALKDDKAIVYEIKHFHPHGEGLEGIRIVTLSKAIEKAAEAYRLIVEKKDNIIKEKNEKIKTFDDDIKIIKRELNKLKRENKRLQEPKEEPRTQMASNLKSYSFKILGYDINLRWRE